MTPRHRLIELTLFVADLDASANFYRALGLDVIEINDPQLHPIRHYDVELGEMTLMQLFPANEKHVANQIQLGFHVHDVTAVASQLDKHGNGWRCSNPNWINTLDPDGNRIHVREQR